MARKKLLRILIVCSFSCFLVSFAGAGEMKQELKIEPRTLLSMFSTYGYQNQRTIWAETQGLHFALPGGVAKMPQTGVYSTFALAGDCEVSFVYDLLDFPQPKEGYGACVSLALDAGDDANKAVNQRVHKTHEGNGITSSVFSETDGQVQEQMHFSKTAAKRGRIGIRRIGKEVIFLSADDPVAPLEEIDRRPFPEATIRVVRFFVDPGGAPIPIDVRIRSVEMRAEEITAGKPRIDPEKTSHWWLWLFPPVAGLLLLRLWQLRRRDA
jgi:hypothetical protein